MGPNTDPLCGFLNSSEIMELFGIARNTLWKYEKLKMFPQGVMIGRQKKWLKKDVAEFQNKLLNGELKLKS